MNDPSPARYGQPGHPYDLERARARDAAADVVARARQHWHETRTTADEALLALRQAMTATVLAEQAFRAAVAAYEAVK